MIMHGHAMLYLNQWQSLKLKTDISMTVLKAKYLNLKIYITYEEFLTSRSYLSFMWNKLMPLIIIKLIYQVGKIKREALKNCCFLNKNYLKQYAGIEPDGT